MRAVLVVSGWLVFMCSVSILAAPPTDAYADAPVVSPVQAGGILDELWTQREAAVAARNRAALTALEEGPALAHELAWMDGTVSYRPGGSGRRGLVGQAVAIPRQLTFPAFFIASARVTSKPDPTGQWVYWTALLVVVRDDAAAPWRIRLETWAAGPPQADAIDRALASDEAEQYAQPAEPLPMAQPALLDRLSRKYFSLHAAAVSPLDVFMVASGTGGDILCFNRDYVEREDRPWWNPARATAGDPRGIPEGHYRKLTATYQDQQCASVDVAPDGSPSINVLSSARGYVSHQEIAAPAPPWLSLALGGCILCIALTLLVWRLRSPAAEEAARKQEVVALVALERQTALASGLRALMYALIIIEVERWLLPRAPITASLVAALVIFGVALRLPPPLRTLRATARIRIARPLNEVFDFVRDLRNEPKWQPLVVSVEPLDGAESARLYRTRQTIAAHAVVEYDVRIDEPDAQRGITSDLLGKWFPERAEWRFVAVPEGTVVTLTRSLELGPLRAIAHGLGRYRRGLRQLTIAALNGLNRSLTGEGASSVPPAVHEPVLSWQYAWLRRIPGLRDSHLALSMASFLGCWILYSILFTDWFATGVMVMLLVHELGHYFEGRRIGLQPRPPVFVLLGAFVLFPGARLDSVAHARLSLAGGLAGALATAVTLGLYVVSGSAHLLPWVAAGAAVNLFGSLLPFITVDVDAILIVVGKWLPLVGAFAALAAGAAATAIGFGDVLIPLIVFLAFLVLRFGHPGRREGGQGSLSTGPRLLIAGAWLTLVAYLSVVFFLAAGWLDLAPIG
jgi:hypothetical protein